VNLDVEQRLAEYGQAIDELSDQITSFQAENELFKSDAMHITADNETEFPFC
jgi:uncharacterized coiled-coil protein SlyX